MLVDVRNSRLPEEVRERVTPLQASANTIILGGDYMRVVLLNKTTMAVTELTGVTNISAVGNVYTLTVSGGTASYSKDDWYLSVLWI